MSSVHGRAAPAGAFLLSLFFFFIFSLYSPPLSPSLRSFLLLYLSSLSSLSLFLSLSLAHFRHTALSILMTFTLEMMIFLYALKCISRLLFEIVIYMGTDVSKYSNLIYICYLFYFIM